MKILIILASALAISPLFAQTTSKPENATKPQGKKNVAIHLPASAATLKAPLTLVDGAISQPEKTELSTGGKAVFDFTIEVAGEYVVRAEVNAPDEDKNSFFINIDAPPESPSMAWDFEVTDGFEERTVSWRGCGDMDWNEFSPKIFKLSAGKHALIVVGREPAQLKTVSIVRWTPPVAGTLSDIQQRYREADSTFEREVRQLPETPEGQKAKTAPSPSSASTATPPFTTPPRRLRKTKSPGARSGIAPKAPAITSPRIGIFGAGPRFT